MAMSENSLRTVSYSVEEYLNFKPRLFGANLRFFEAAEILLLIL